MYLKIRKLRNQFYTRVGREPTNEETAGLLGMPLEKCEKSIKEFIKNRAAITSLDMKIGDNEESTIGEFIVEEKTIYQPEAATSSKLLKSHIDDLLSGMSHRSVLIIKMKYGLDGHKEHSLEGIGKCLGITRERVRQILAKALDSIRDSKHSLKIIDFLDE